MNGKEVQRLILENNRLAAENERLRVNQLPHCRGCRKLTTHDCGAFYWCQRLGAVDPDRDGCSRREAAG